jgi:hypothetical protein
MNQTDERQNQYTGECQAIISQVEAALDLHTKAQAALEAHTRALQEASQILQSILAERDSDFDQATERYLSAYAKVRLLEARSNTNVVTAALRDLVDVVVKAERFVAVAGRQLYTRVTNEVIAELCSKVNLMPHRAPDEIKKLAYSTPKAIKAEKLNNIRSLSTNAVGEYPPGSVLGHANTVIRELKRLAEFEV